MFELLEHWEAHVALISCIKVIKENKIIITGSHDKLIKIWVNNI